MTAVTLVQNDAKQGLELHFPDKPSNDVLAEIHAENERPGANRWRFHFVKKIWYARNTPETKAWAEAFVAGHSSNAPAVSAALEPEPAPVPIQPETNIVPVNFDVTPPVPIQPAPPLIPAWRRRTTL